MEPEKKVDYADSEPSDSQVITYAAPWNIFSLGFSNKRKHPFRLAIGSFLPDLNNEVEIIQMTDRNTLEKKMSFPHEYPPTKLMFIPDDGNERPDLLATSG